MLDNISGQTIDYSGAQNLSTVVTLLNLLSNNIDSGAINSFNIQTFSGSVYNKTTDPMSNKVIILNEEQHVYRLKMLFIAKQTGNYVLTISNASGVYTKNN